MYVFLFCFCIDVCFSLCITRFAYLFIHLVTNNYENGTSEKDKSWSGMYAHDIADIR